MPTATKDPETEAADGGNGPPAISLTAAGDPVPPTAGPLILTDGYVEVNGVNLRCLGMHFEVNPENKPVTVTTFCAEVDYPAVTKWHFIAKFAQSFDSGATDATLRAAVNAYKTSGTYAQFKVRGKSALAVSATNPQFSGFVIPTDYRYIGGDAGALSEVDVDWILTAPPSVDTGAVTATGATAGSPGFFTPSGANPPANLAALTGLAATPATAWATGQFVRTADQLGSHWSGSAWVAGAA
jgi:hypothetical protein